MKTSLKFLLLATIVASCSADCRSGLNGRQDWYECDGSLETVINGVPADAKGIHVKCSGPSSIPKIPSNAFSKFSNSLTELNVTGCQVEEIEAHAFRGLTKLQILGLVNNKIRKIQASWIVDLENLYGLIVWRNRIDEIETQVYDMLPNLEVWDVAYNELKQCLSPELLKKLRKLRRILIAGNPWSYRCRSHMTWYLGSNHIRFVKDWSISDLLIEECLAHEPGAETDDVILNKCVDRKVGSSDTLPYDVAGLNERVRELSNKVSQLETDIAALKKSGH